LDAFSIYITLAAVFIAQATNTPIGMADLLTILAIALVTTKGAHGVPGSAIVVLAATLHAIPAIPAIGLVLVLSVDWFMGIARALAQQPQVILADEPVASLDPKTARSVLQYLRDATRELGIAVVCNLHQVDYAREFGDRVLGLAQGRMVYDGSPQALDEAALQAIYHAQPTAGQGAGQGAEPDTPPGTAAIGPAGLHAQAPVPASWMRASAPA
ncbi:cation:dicarboxylase symporter family transporter, partial [Bacillus cereus group sp. BY17LC]